MVLVGVQQISQSLVSAFLSRSFVEHRRTVFCVGILEESLKFSHVVHDLLLFVQKFGIIGLSSLAFVDA
jgi:hypothetical protein